MRKIKQSIISVYSNAISRDYPVLWSTRLDIAIFVLIVLLPISIYAASNYDFKLAKTFTYRDSLATFAFVFGGTSLAISFVWVYEILNTLRTECAPKLRYIKMSVACHFGSALLAAPVIIGIGVMLYRHNNLNAMEDFFIYSVATMSIASLLSCFSAIALKYSIQDALIGVISSIFTYVIWIPILSVAGRNYNEAFNAAYTPLHMNILVAVIISLYFMIFATHGMSNTSIWRYILFYPLYLCLSAGPMFIMSFSFLDSLEKNYSSVRIKDAIREDMSFTIIFTATIYCFSAMMTQVLLQRAGRQRPLA